MNKRKNNSPLYLGQKNFNGKNYVPNNNSLDEKKFKVTPQ